MKKDELEIKELIKKLSEKIDDSWKKEYGALPQEEKWNYTENIADISELKIHKILYFLYGGYYASTGKELLEKPEFQSWKHGPVEVNYRKNLEMFLLIDDEKELDRVEKILESLIKMNTWSLVDLSHDTQPWIDAGSGEYFHRTIPNKQIKKYFKEEFFS